MAYTGPMRDKPWAAVPLLDPNGETFWYATETEALTATDRPADESYTFQYRPGRKAKVRK